ncbi:DUF4156 domain-containing protein [Methylobacterium sp. ARG-1]|uniref:DUF4156 domain-containing protein n=1 Tax=Methylobacterium sp. ARG-1 TaxID=1692501 RepID=UPI000681945A|nr:DUF4156 domain-containing protein [Methylobacterium sp. ARG-1]KNY21649.1 hypothetical protein AKJ13_15485 [Methylobacterium sp. ARG-1]
MVRWVVGSLALACFVAGTAHAQTVRIVRDQAAVAGCQRLGEVRGSSLVGGALGGLGYDNMIAEMQEKAAAVNGNSLLLVDTQTGIMGAKGIGEAYRCEAPEEASPKRRGRRG